MSNKSFYQSKAYQAYQKKWYDTFYKMTDAMAETSCSQLCMPVLASYDRRRRVWPETPVYVSCAYLKMDAILTFYTGFLFSEMSYLYKLAGALAESPVYTHELPGFHLQFTSLAEVMIPDLKRLLPFREGVDPKGYITYASNALGIYGLMFPHLTPKVHLQ